MQDEQSLDFLLQNFSGGINESIDDMLISINEAAKANNIKLDNGILESAAGYAEYAFNSLCPIHVKTLMCFNNLQVNGLLVAGDGKIYHYKNNVWTLIKSGMSSDYYDYVNFEVVDYSTNPGTNHDCMIIGNGIDKTFVYRDDGQYRDLLNRTVITQEDASTHKITEYLMNGNGTQIATAVQPAHVNAYDTNIANMTYAPKLKFIELHMDRIWGSDGKNTVYFSSANKNGFDIDDWTYPKWPDYEVNNHGGYIDIPTWDGGSIIGIKTVFNDVVVFKNRNIFRIFGTYPGNYVKEQIFSTTGGIADKSIVQGENAAYFAAFDGIYLYNGSSVRRISDKIKNIWNNLNHNKDSNGVYYLSKAVGAWYNNKYLLAVPDSGSTVNNLLIELNTLTGAFMVHKGYTIASFIDFQDKLLFSNGIGQVIYEFNKGDKLYITPMDCYYESGTLFADSVDAKKATNELYVIAKGSGTINITGVTDYETPTSISIALTDNYKIYKLKFRNKGRTIKLKIQNVNGDFSTSTFSIKLIKFRFDADRD